MTEFSWHVFYQSDLQAVYALMIAPIAFLAYRIVAAPDPASAARPAASRFVAGLTLLFAIETMLDPIATGPLLATDALRETGAAALIPFLFVYLGDLRVLLLAKGVAHPDLGLARNLAWAGGVGLIVPIWAGLGFGLARWISPDVHGQLLWILYEAGFFALSIVMGRVWVPRHCSSAPEVATYLRTILGYSAAYYALWLAADFLIVGRGLDLGWAIRIVPNQLYYAFWVPFVYARFFSGVGPKAVR